MERLLLPGGMPHPTHERLGTVLRRRRAKGGPARRPGRDGVGDIPVRWLLRLQNREAIESRAEALHAGSSIGQDIPDLVDREHDLSAQENAYRESLLAHSQSGGDLGANSSRF